jgi:hypothetical protein
MAMTYTATLSCNRCETVVRFEDERPAWKTYDYRVEEADECEKSARFVAENADKPAPDLLARWPEWEAAGRPDFIRVGRYLPGGRRYRYADLTEGDSGLYLTIPDPYRYIDCPVCDERIREPK